MSAEKKQSLRSLFKALFERPSPSPSTPPHENATSDASSRKLPASQSNLSLSETALSQSLPIPAPVVTKQTASDASIPINVTEENSKEGHNKSGFMTIDTAEDCLSVAGSLMTMLMKRVPDFVDGNPVTVAFGLANAIIEISANVTGNTSAIEQQIIWTSAQLLIVERALVGWKAKNTNEADGMKSFEQKLEEQLKRLIQLKKQSLFRRIATHEDVQSEIGEIFAQVIKQGRSSCWRRDWQFIGRFGRFKKHLRNPFSETSNPRRWRITSIMRKVKNASYSGANPAPQGRALGSWML